MNAHKAVDWIIEHREEYAQAKATRVYLEEFRKSKKALLMKDALANGIEAANAQEREAYSHPEYQQLLKDLQTAIEVEENIKWMMEAARMRVEIWKSEEYSNRMTDKATT
jgi:hypothetical protein